MSFSPRMTAPSASDLNWIHTSKGGKNECILISGKSCLPNCVGYAWGRWYEILGSRPLLSRANAENWYSYTSDGYKRSKEPSLGAVVCWAKGKVGVSSDGAGHVAIVEEIKSNGDIVTSNSGYKSKRFWTQTFKKSNGYAMNGYTFQGFIHLPNTVQTPSTPSKNDSKIVKVNPYLVKITSTDLRIRKGPGTNTDIVQYIKPGAYTITEEANGPGATRWGHLKSKIGWISLDHVTKI